MLEGQRPCTILSFNFHTTVEYLTIGDLLQHISKSIVVCGRSTPKMLTKIYNTKIKKFGGYTRAELLPFINYVLICFILAKAEVYKNEGNDEYGKKNFRNAVNFYTEGIKVNCKDEELKAKLYCNRAAAHFRLGERFYFNLFIYLFVYLFSIYLVTVVKVLAQLILKMN